MPTSGDDEARGGSSARAAAQGGRAGQTAPGAAPRLGQLCLLGGDALGSGLGPADAADREAHWRAVCKLRNGGTPSKEEARAHRRVERELREQLAWEFYRAIPQKHWRQLSGRQAKVLGEQAERYGIPVGGREIDLGAVARWIHDFLARHARAIAAVAENEDGDANLVGDETRQPVLRRYRLARAKREEAKLEVELGNWVPRAEVHAEHVRLAQLLRDCGERLAREVGNEAAEILAETLDDFERQAGCSPAESAEPT